MLLGLNLSQHLELIYSTPGLGGCNNAGFVLGIRSSSYIYIEIEILPYCIFRETGRGRTTQHDLILQFCMIVR